MSELLDMKKRARKDSYVALWASSGRKLKVTHSYKYTLAGKTIYVITEAHNLSLWDAIFKITLHLRAKNFSSHCLAIPETLTRVMYKEDMQSLACENSRGLTSGGFQTPRERLPRFEPKYSILMTSNRNRKLLLYRVTIMHKWAAAALGELTLFFRRNPVKNLKLS